MDRYIQLNDIRIGKGCKITFTDIEGLSAGTGSRYETTYIAEDGADYSNIFYQPRSIKISGHIIAESVAELAALQKHLTVCCNIKKPIDVCYYNGINKRYRCTAYADALPEYGQRKQFTKEFVINLQNPKFYWLSDEECRTGAYEVNVTPLLTKDSTLPTIFSSRGEPIMVQNIGDVDTYPIITLFCNTPNTEDIIIRNATTDEYFKILKSRYTMEQGEVITIDMTQKTIYNSRGNNLLRCIDLQSKFWALSCGDNYVTINNHAIQCNLTYRNQFIGV